MSAVFAQPETDRSTIDALAETLWWAEHSGQPCEPIGNQFAEGDLSAAYAVQRINTERQLAAGKRMVGRKIGLTSRSVQAQLGVDQPDFGMLFSDMAVCDNEPVAASRVLQPKVEAEVAFVMGRDLDIEDPTVADLFRSIDYAVAAIEIVGSRIADWRITLLDTVADNASSGLFVLGNTPRSLDGLDLRDCGMRMRQSDGETVSEGVGHACLGHPLNATLWLARMMAQLDRPLRAGDIVLSGALGPMATVTAGESYTAEIDGLGKVSACFE